MDQDLKKLLSQVTKYLSKKMDKNKEEVLEKLEELAEPEEVEEEPEEQDDTFNFDSDEKEEVISDEDAEEDSDDIDEEDDDTNEYPFSDTNEEYKGTRSVKSDLPKSPLVKKSLKPKKKGKK